MEPNNVNIYLAFITRASDIALEGKKQKYDCPGLIRMKQIMDNQHKPIN